MYFSVIGNAYPTRDFSKEIQGANSIFRINYANYLDSGKIGKDTDVLIFKIPHLKDDILIKDALYNSAVYDCSHVWFLNDKPKFLEAMSELYCLYNKKVVTVDNNWAIRQWKYLWNYYGEDFFPSLNISILAFLISEYPSIPKRVFCLDDLTDIRHNYGIENLLLQMWEKSGDIEVVMND